MLSFGSWLTVTNIVGPLMVSKGHRYLLTIVDRYTRWAEAIPLPTIDADVVANNLLLHWIARFGVPRTIARVNNPHNAWLFDENFHVDVALNQANVFASLIQEEMSLGDMMTLLKLRRGQYSLVEEKVPAGAKAIGVAIKDLGLPNECVIAAIIRDGKITLPRGNATLQQDDEVLAVTDPDGARQLAELLAPAQK